MSDLDNSVSEESRSEIENVKNGTSEVDIVKDDNNKSIDVQAQKEKSGKVVDKKADDDDEDGDGDVEMTDVTEKEKPKKVNGSASNRKKKTVIPNGDDHKKTNGETTSQSGDEDSNNTPVTRRSSPRKAAIESRAATMAQEMSDEEEKEVQEIDESSSDSIVELDAEDPLADPLGSAPVSKPEAEKSKTTSNGAKILTLDNVKAIQNLAAKQQPRESKVTLIDTSKILAGKTTSGGVTITPAQPKVLSPGGPSLNLGYGVSISRTTVGAKPMGRDVGLPSGTTMTSMSSGFASRPSGGLGYATVQSSSVPKVETTPAMPADPNLTDDMFVLEAPSFVVPYVYEKPAKESFKDFKESVDKLVEELKKKDSEKKDDEDSETKDKVEDEKEEKKDAEVPPVTEVKKPIPNGPYFETSLGKFVVDLGMNLVQEMVQQDLLKEVTKKSQKDKSVATMRSIASLKANLESSKKRNEGFHFELEKCPRCTFQTESELVLAHHQETLHVKNGFYRCSFCRFDSPHVHEVRAHMKNIHGVEARVDPPPVFLQCPQCNYDTDNRGKLTRHKITCDKRFRPETNQLPSHDWEPPAKMPKVSQYNNYTRVVTPSRPNVVPPNNFQGFNGVNTNAWPAGIVAAAANAMNSTKYSGIPQQLRNIPAGMPQFQMDPRNRLNQQPGYRQVSITNQTRLQYAAGSSASLINSLVSNPAVTIQSISQRNSSPGSSQGIGRANPPSQQLPPRPGQPRQQQGKGGFVICEICDGYIKDLEQLKNHMNWIHKIKIHPKMIYQRPPLNCQKCQFRFFTDQGLERHLLGSHGLVTASMQDLATKGQDSGRCPICGKVYQWKLLNHVAKDHQKTLKPAHLSYKCTVCEATFCQYKLFETHVYSTHGAGNKKTAGEKESAAAGPSSSATTSPTVESSSGDKVNKEKTNATSPPSKKEAPKSLLKSNNPVEDVIELDDEEMDEDEDSVQSVPEKSTATSSSDEPKSANPKSSLEDEEEEVEEISDDEDH